MKFLLFLFIVSDSHKGTFDMLKPLHGEKRKLILLLNILTNKQIFFYY